MRLLFLVLLLSQLALSYNTSYGSNATDAILRIQMLVETNATTQQEYQAYIESHSLIVLGSDMDIGERLLLESARTQNAWLARTAEAKDSAETLTAIESGRYAFVILIGGPFQNSITKKAESSDWFNETMTLDGGLALKTGRHNGTVVISFSDSKGYSEGLKRESVEHSPLAAFMPKEYVPVAATGISIILLALINVGRTVFEFKALDIGRKGKKVGQGAWFVNGINMSEAIAIIGASLVLGLSISWQYFSSGNDFFSWLLINSLICLFAALMHEVTHRIFAHLYKIDMEYRFWPAGSALTLISSYLGNAFSVQAFILEEIPQNTPKWKVGLMKLSAVLLSAFTMIGFAVLNLYSPNPIYKIIYTTSALWAMAEILPFGSLDGKDIIEWNRLVWEATFAFISISYIIITFLM